MAYNGWANYETWNVELWIDNDEGLYLAKQDFLKRHYSRHITSKTVKAFCMELFPNGTPDLKCAERMSKVKWTELASSWRAERKENAKYW